MEEDMLSFEEIRLIIDRHLILNENWRLSTSDTYICDIKELFSIEVGETNHNTPYIDEQYVVDNNRFINIKKGDKIVGTISTSDKSEQITNFINIIYDIAEKKKDEIIKRERERIHKEQETARTLKEVALRIDVAITRQLLCTLDSKIPEENLTPDEIKLFVDDLPLKIDWTPYTVPENYVCYEEGYSYHVPPGIKIEIGEKNDRTDSWKFIYISQDDFLIGGISVNESDATTRQEDYKYITEKLSILKANRAKFVSRVESEKKSAKEKEDIINRVTHNKIVENFRQKLNA